jgi:hypothetical protein
MNGYGRRWSYLILTFALVFLLVPNISHASGTSTPYDEQLGITYTQDYTSLAYNVTAIAQSSSGGYGPAYLLNGYSNTGYWYQVGLSYNWLPNQGWAVSYEVFDPNGRSIYPQNGGGGTLEFNGPINQGDKVLLNLYFSGGSVIMLAKDLNTGSSFSTSYSAEGASTFVGNPYATATNGYFTGLMTEWYHSNPYYGNEQGVNYSIFGSTSNAAAWLWADEFYCADINCYQKQNIFWNSTVSPISFTSPSLYEFYSNGATEYANSRTYISGSYSPSNIPTTTIPSGLSQTTTINYPYINNVSIVKIQYNATLPQIVTSSHILSVSGIGQSNNFYLTDPTDVDLSGISNLLNITSSSMNNIVLLDLSGVGNNITIVNGNISVDLSGINNIVTLKNAKARILAGISGINNTIYLINSTLIGGNKFGIDNKIISYQRGIIGFSNETIPITQISTTTIPFYTTAPTTIIQHTSQNTTTIITSNNQTSNSGFGGTFSNFIASIENFFASIFGNSGAQYTTTFPTTIQYTLNSTTSIYTTVPYITTISSTGSGSCSSFELTESSASSSTSGSCSWLGGYLTLAYSTGQLVAITLNITNNNGFASNINANTSGSYPLYCLSNTQSEYLPSGTYYIKLFTGARGATCSNSHAYVTLSG